MPERASVRPKPQEEDEMPRNILCLVAGQRSGTTALQSALASTGQFHDFGEIFQTSDVRRSGNFLDYAGERGLQVVEIASEAGSQKVIEDYLEHLSEMAEPKFPLIDIKFNSWNALRSFWTYPTQEPQILQLLRQRGAVFIFVLRRDLAAQIISERIARATAKWHDLSAEEISASITVPVAQACLQARLILDAERLLFSYLVPTRRVFPVWYEDLYLDDGSIIGDLPSWLAGQFGTAVPTPMRPAIRKNTVSKAQVVENYEEVSGRIAAIISESGRVEF